MTNEVTVSVKGLREAEEFLLEIGSQAAGRALRASMLRAATPLVAMAKTFAPVRSGALLSSIKPVYVPGGVVRGGRRGRTLRQIGSEETAAVVRIGPVANNKTAVALNNFFYRAGGRRKRVRGIYYGHMVEKGTKNMKASPFLKPAFNAGATSAVEDFRSNLFQRINRIRNRRPTDRKPTR